MRFISSLAILCFFFYVVCAQLPLQVERQAVGTLASAVVTGATTVATTVTSDTNSALSTVATGVTTALSTVTTDVTSIITTVTTGVTSLVTSVTTDVTSSVTSVTSQVTTGVNALTSAGNTLTSAVGTIVTSATSLLTSATTSTAGCSGFNCQCSSKLNTTLGRATCSAGKWVVDGSTVNDDALVFGSLDTLTIIGNYTSTDNSELTIWSSGKNKGPIIMVTGHAHLSGTLTIDLTTWTEARRGLFASFFARESASTNITIIQASSVSGQFSSVKTKTAKGSCQTATPSYTSTTVLIGVSSSNKCGNNKSRTVAIAVTASVVGFFIIAAIVITLALFYGIRYRPRRFNKLFVSGTSRIGNDEF